MRAERKRLLWIGAVSAAAVCFAPFVGVELIRLRDLTDSDALRYRIFWELRVPRVLLAYLAGASLAVSGTVFQALFQNMLATPFTLGVSSGAACGAALYIAVAASCAAAHVSGQALAAFVGAVFTVVLVYGLSRATRLSGNVSLLLAGVVLNFFFSSLILFLQYMGDFGEVFRMTRWLIGSVESVGFTNAGLIAPFAVLCLILVTACGRSLDLMTFGEEFALSRGVPVGTIRLLLYATVSLAVAAIVALCGVISFIGIMVPCVTRPLVSSRHVFLVPAAWMLGGVFLVLCDAAARTIAAPVDIPVGIITALMGGPFFLFVLIVLRRTEIEPGAVCI